jgi:hypothetical protein
VQTDAEALCGYANLWMHPIIKYIGGEVTQAGRANEGLDLFALTVNVV